MKADIRQPGEGRWAIRELAHVPPIELAVRWRRWKWTPLPNKTTGWPGTSSTGRLIAMRAERRVERLISSEETEKRFMGRMQSALGSAGLGLMARMR